MNEMCFEDGARECHDEFEWIFPLTFSKKLKGTLNFQEELDKLNIFFCYPGTK